MSADNRAGKTEYGMTINNKDKAYLFGVYLGDGCCYKSPSCSFSIASGDKDVIEKTSSIVNQHFNKNSKIKLIKPNNTQLYYFRVYSKALFEMLTSQTKNKSELPEFVINSDKETKSEFVAALMDTDGYISTGVNKFGWQRYSLGFINSGEWLNNFIMLLQNLGIKVGKKTLKKKYRSLNEKDCYQININLRSFVEEGLYFSCQRKQALLERYKSNVKFQSYQNPQRTYAKHN